MARDASSDWLVGLFIGFGFGAAGVAGALAWVSSTIGAASIPIWGMTIFCVGAVFKGPFGRAIAARIAGSGHENDDLYAEIDEMRERLGEISAEHRLVAELEERLEFTERLLAQRDAKQA